MLKLRLRFGSARELTEFITTNVMDVDVMCNVREVSWDFTDLQCCELYISGFQMELIDICFQYLKNYRDNNDIDGDFFIIDWTEPV